MKPTVIFIVGPTAAGKTALSLLLAEKLQGEIVSADSRQIYKYMNIGTAKPSKKELAQVPHHFIDILEPDEEYNVGKFFKDGRETISKIFSKGKTPIVTGGSGLYIRALIDGIFNAPEISPAIRKIVLSDLERHGSAYLYKKLSEIDPRYASKISANDPQRITRALEVYLSSGIPFSQWHHKKTDKAQFKPLMYGITMDRAELYTRINKRVDRMLTIGLIEEVKALQEKGFGASLNALKTVGYKEVFQYLDRRLDYDTMIEKIKQNTRNYAKRQITWFKKEKRIHWINMEDEKQKTAAADSIIKRYER